MSYPAVINEIASAINAVINVIAWSVLKVLPVLITLLIGLIAIDFFVGSMFDSEADTETPFLSESGQTDIRLTSNATMNVDTVPQD